MQPITTTSQETQQEAPVSAKPVVEEAKQTEVQVKMLEIAEEAQKGSGSIRPEIRPHAFVVMPFGKKKGGDGSIYDFNAIYAQLIKPTLEGAGFESFRADEESTSGDILTDMFQELLLADLVLADMSIDNANVFYELGIRHAFRKRGVVHIQAGRAYMPFDIFNVRTIPYHITPEGVPDPEFLEKDKAAITRVCRATWASEPERVHSPIYNLLTGLVEPERKTLRTPLATGFWREYNEWKQRVTIAQRQRRIGDILLLTEEISNPLIKEEAVGEAGKALQSMDRYELALEQYRKGLEINSRNLEFRRQEAIFLNRLSREEEAIVKLESLLNDFPSDAEAIGTLGRIYKDVWTDSWKWIKDKDKRLRTAYDSYHWLVKAFHTYLKGFKCDLDNTYPGVNALTLGIILIDLANHFEDTQDPDPEIVQIREMLPDLRATLLFALDVKTQDEKTDYWTLASLAELHVMTAERTQKITRAYRKALTAARRNIFSLQSSLNQLEMLHSLDMRSEFVQAGIVAIQEELRRLRKEEVSEDGGEVHHIPARKIEGDIFLFTGYMISNSRKKENQFPPEKESDIRQAIQNVLKKYNAGPNDLAVTTGMDAGSELLFVEVCVERGIPVQAYFATYEAPYVRDFVSPGGEQWIERFYKMRNHPLVDEFYQPDKVGPPKEGDNVHERNNRWALYSALARGIDKLRLIAVWDGKGEMSKDLDVRLVKHMVELMRDRGGMVEPINPFKLMLLPETVPELKDSLPTVSQPAPVQEEPPQEKEPVKEEELPKETERAPLKSKGTKKKK
ncbi:MAG TPA: TRAFs-binding domain-containing protein [Anaerolineales bacterium]|nr:TRAFs-binding domain-containing protein [Anaerolineales bacterium]